MCAAHRVRTRPAVPNAARATQPVCGRSCSHPRLRCARMPRLPRKAARQECAQGVAAQADALPPCLRSVPARAQMLPIDTSREDIKDNLKRSQLGSRIMFLAKCPEESQANRRMAVELVQAWSRWAARGARAAGLGGRGLWWPAPPQLCCLRPGLVRGGARAKRTAPCSSSPTPPQANLL